MNDPKNPVPQGFVGLRAYPTDVVLRGSIAIIGTSLNKVLLVNLTDPAQPIAAGEIDPNPGMVLGNRLTVTDSGLIISSSPNPATGGVQVSKLDSACRQFRAQLRSTPPSPATITITPAGQLAWSMSAGVSAVSPLTQQTLDKDGLVLTNVNLGRRQMAKMMSLPYVIIQRTPTSSTTPAYLRCSLSNANNPACDGSTTARSRLLTYGTFPSGDGTNFFIQAQYVIDLLDGDSQHDTTLPDSCVLLTQRYEFFKEGLDPFEPNGKLGAARFKPIVEYTYSTDPGGPQLMSLTTAQRLQLDARDINNAPEPKAPANATLLTCDHDSGLDYPCVITPNFFGVFQTNPLKTNHYQTSIQSAVMIPLPVPGGAALSLRGTIIDTVHHSP